MKKIFVALMLCGAAASAQVSDDSGLLEGPPDSAAAILKEARHSDGALLFRAEALPGTGSESAEGVYSGTLLITDEKGATVPGQMAEVTLKTASGVAGRAETDADGNWSIEYAGPRASVRVRLQNKYWSIRNASSGAPYEWEAATGTFRLDPSSANGEIGFIHAQFVKAIRFIEGSGVSASWWKRTVAVKYPGDANYYTGDSIVLTRAKAWDVNLHEFGHAVMYGGTDTHGGGGYHQISKCYTEGLAWSEGFATFFAGAVGLPRGAADAKFEYLAGGMAMENVPDSACKGDTNEWRVGAALWDIFDSHQDGQDKAELGFERTWNPIQGRTMGGFKDAWKYMKAALQQDELKAVQGVFELNALPERAAAAF